MNYLGLRDDDKVGIIEPFKGLVATRYLLDDQVEKPLLSRMSYRPFRTLKSPEHLWFTS